MNQIKNNNETQETNVFPFIIISIIIMLCIAGCKSTQKLAVSERVTHDTCYLSNIQFDSIYIQNDNTSEYRLNPLNYSISSTPSNYSVPEQSRRTNSSNSSNSTIHPDTLILTKSSVKTKYKMLRDTIKVIQHDSIPYQVKVVETKTERYTPWYARALAFIGFLAFIYVIIRLAIKFWKP